MYLLKSKLDSSSIIWNWNGIEFYCCNRWIWLSICIGRSLSNGWKTSKQFVWISEAGGGGLNLPMKYSVIQLRSGVMMCLALSRLSPLIKRVHYERNTVAHRQLNRLVSCQSHARQSSPFSFSLSLSLFLSLSLSLSLSFSLSFSLSLKW